MWRSSFLWVLMSKMKQPSSTRCRSTWENSVLQSENRKMWLIESNTQQITSIRLFKRNLTISCRDNLACGTFLAAIANILLERSTPKHRSYSPNASRPSLCRDRVPKRFSPLGSHCGCTC